MKEKTAERDELINGNYGLVHSCANRFRGRGVEYDDLFQAGCMGLIKAANNFDKERGFAFSTYAVPVILGEIKRIFRDGGLVKVGRSLKEKSRNALKVSEEMAKKLGREPTVSELAKEMNIDIFEASQLITVSMPALSLTAEDEKGNSQLDIPISSKEDELTEKMALSSVIASLDDRDKKLIELRYYKGMTQVKTANELGMSQVQVSRREKAILLKMRQEML